MLSYIKSKYITEIIFSFIDEKAKLEIIKYNNNLKNCLNINIFNYMLFSKRYIIYETKRKGREYYYNGNLLFEGEYLNGKRNGKGKEYHSYSGEIKFEGEYLNGKRNGKGKEYDLNFKILIYDGEFMNGVRNGKGKEYNCSGYLIYDGEYLNGVRNGKGIEYYYNGNLEFVGEYLNGKQYDLKNNNIYELINGTGFQKIHNIYPGYSGLLEFEGEFVNGIKKKEKNILKII